MKKHCFPKLFPRQANGGTFALEARCLQKHLATFLASNKKKSIASCMQKTILVCLNRETLKETMFPCLQGPYNKHRPVEKQLPLDLSFCLKVATQLIML